MNENTDDQRLNAGRRIKTARSLAGISRKDLEEKFGISMHTLQSWELGRNPLNEKTASKLVEILHNAGVSCSMQWLLNGSGKSPSLLNSDFVPFPALDKDIAPLLSQESSIQREIEFFKSNNPNAIAVMVSDDTMEPIYSKGDFVGGVQYFNPSDIEKCIGHDCIIELSEGTYVRRLMKRKDGFAITCLNPQTETEEPVIFTKKILVATPIIWHRWKLRV
ncbi:helix-turn-helix domain-containing protein [Legionella sp. 16cNR16C]|uniref:helix-turn-helix domain-containing protein n=1 Tax=Legionella sp. 16cNR16C TaxID=2905656 RepID=UPI001E439E09|nr:helix-turn-helix domain-containing protein [Legionella sp. 16cNR16C]MCE3043983.1 helix-turn-helix domain-containing protein [Legionella sp. 16cNR16C]